jgi:hypothetical protein
VTTLLYDTEIFASHRVYVRASARSRRHFASTLAGARPLLCGHWLLGVDAPSALPRSHHRIRSMLTSTHTQFDCSSENKTCASTLSGWYFALLVLRIAFARSSHRSRSVWCIVVPVAQVDGPSLPRSHLEQTLDAHVDPLGDANDIAHSTCGDTSLPRS